MNFLTLICLLLSPVAYTQGLEKSEITLVISTHISDDYDFKKTSFKGAKKVFSIAIVNKWPIFELKNCQECESPYDTFSSKPKKYYYLESVAGEIDIKHNATTIISLGGYPGACLYNTLKYLLEGNSNQLTIKKVIYITDAIFGETVFDNFISRKRSLQLTASKGFYHLADVLQSFENNNKMIKLFLYELFQFGSSNQDERNFFLSQYNFILHYQNLKFPFSQNTEKPQIDILFMTSQELSKLQQLYLMLFKNFNKFS